MTKKIAILFTLATLLLGCNNIDHNENKKTIYVTISPLKSIVEHITCGDYNVEVIVPDGASPETYEPTAKQLTAFSSAEQIYAIGLINFELSLIEHISDTERITNLSNGIELMEGSCSHGHHHHSHGVDPHIWTSPRALKTMVEAIRSTTMRMHPDSTKYSAAADKLINDIESLDNLCNNMISSADIKAIMIYHPAYTYYARDYGINQIAIEHDGKEPSPKQLTSLVEQAREYNIQTIFIQPQYSKDKITPIANECGAQVVETNPLSTDILAEIERITTIICNGYE